LVEVAMLSFSADDAEYIEQLAEFVAIPSISRDASPETMRTAADWVASHLQFANGRTVETGGNPVVVGELSGPPGAPTILVYGHYDGRVRRLN
jgi:acetylornithine deacetylase/succinyl-diaminopimelate desuccinylase-like protein